MNLFDDDDFMVTSPKENFFAISKTANKNIVEMELEKMLERLAVAEKMLEDKGLEAEFEQTYSIMRAEVSDLENRVNSIFIELVGNIVTQCE
ncbi:MAG: DUF2018 family protein [Campylobacterales bacterium]|nr:DUF2018 family protein [Campylobacterales bacterium]